MQGAADGVLIFVLRLTLRGYPFILGPATPRGHGHRGRAVDFHIAVFPFFVFFVRQSGIFPLYLYIGPIFFSFVTLLKTFFCLFEV